MSIGTNSRIRQAWRRTEIERARQITKGYTAAHDQKYYPNGELLLAANIVLGTAPNDARWPLKGGDPEKLRALPQAERLVVANALLTAERDRLRLLIEANNRAADNITMPGVRPIPE